MIPIPLPVLKYGLIAFAVAAVAATAYVKGRKDVRVLWDAERAAIAVTAAKAEAKAKETELIWSKAAIVAGEKYHEQIKVSRNRAQSELSRLRDSATRSRPVSATAGTASCSCPASESTRAELVAIGETVIGLVEFADASRAGLEACLAAWPR